MSKLFISSILLFLLMSLYALPPEVLQKRFNEVTFVMTHNSASVIDKENKRAASLREKALNLFPKSFKTSREQLGKIIDSIHIFSPVADQQQPIEKQLADGVRAFKIPMHVRIVDGKETLWSCHTVGAGQLDDLLKTADTQLQQILPKGGLAGVTDALRESILSLATPFKNDRCLLDTSHKPMSEIFNTLGKWLDDNPKEVLGMYLDIGLTSAQIQQHFNTMAKLLIDSGLSKKVLMHKPGDPWPTIEEMITRNKRFILYGATKGYWDKIGIYQEKDVGFGTNYNYPNLDKLKADSDNPKIDWGTAGKDKLFVVDNYTTVAISGSPEGAKAANSYDALKQRVINYSKFVGQPVTFIMVDYYDEPAGKPGAIKLAEDINKGLVSLA